MQTLARFVTRHAWAVLILWALVAALSAPFAARTPARLTATPGSLPNAESTRVTNLLAERFGEGSTNSVLLVTRSAVPTSDPTFRRVYTAFMRAVEGVQGVARVVPYDAQSVYPTVSPDQRRTLSVAFIPVGDGASETLARIRALAERAPPLLGVRVTGGQAIADDFTALAENDTKRSEFAALPLTGVVLLLVFGALVATGLPLVIGVLSITVALGCLYGLTFLTDVSTFAQSVITLLGLGAGIDYALLMVNRYREELARDHDARAAAYRTALTAGRSVMFSGLTVAVAMAALIVPPIAFVRSMGIGGVLAVLLTVLASVTALPALLALLGERVNSPRLLRAPFAQHAGVSAAWTVFARRVTARPWLAVVASTALLLLLAAPALNMRTGYAGAWGLTENVESRAALKDVQTLGAGGVLSSFEVIIDLGAGQRYGPDTRATFRAAVDRLRAVPGVHTVVSPFVTPEQLRTGTTLGSSLEALATLTRRSVSDDRRYLRVTVLPERYLRADQIDPFQAKLRAALRGAGVRALLGGAPIGEREFSRAITNAIPAAILTVFAGTFVLLMLAFRSLLVPLKSLLMNSLTVGAAYGVVTLVVQGGVLAGPLGIPQDVGVLDSTLPLILFAVMFGLSMDYEIFLLSRVHEEVLRGVPNDEAVVLAVGRTARIITSAALIMFIVFCAFIVGRVVANKSIGLGLAVAVLLDATVVRLVLVPAFLKLAGRWNWWLPPWLDRRLPHIHVEH
ncbi:MMPL family transporter [Deinococcus maricopensis]|uniref:MMPL domain protein n=1 Tax=Deinococcus maricopensis (strain DSM 21211 / LMG 22137 / NRRL B-23946 / LB-34) TaxID=709986 RepID=E8UBE3_DEIML|nr:MMPL family transporter [Deinococcus maricopensis]ADV68382.1 MMPL domain protein [Deinococcus maricopensis DSM 21211]